MPRLRCAATQVLFYCHFPDLLLAQKRSGIHGLYRAPLDAAEELTTGQAHKILVNSKYTQGKQTSSIGDNRTPKTSHLHGWVPVPRHRW